MANRFPFGVGETLLSYALLVHDSLSYEAFPVRSLIFDRSMNDVKVLRCFNLLMLKIVELQNKNVVLKKIFQMFTIFMSIYDPYKSRFHFQERIQSLFLPLFWL